MGDSIVQPVSQNTGLTDAEVLRIREESGENELPKSRGPTAMSILLSQFKSPLIYIILAAAIISLIVGEVGDFAIIMAVVLIDVVLGFIQEYQAHKTYAALKGLLKPTTTVMRSGVRREIEVRELVPADIVVLHAGEHVPGDGEVIESTKLALEEAILTGESEPVMKGEAAGSNKVFMGTTVVTGRGLMRVTATGASTELGRIASSLQEGKEELTPLQVRLNAFSKTLTLIVSLVTVAILAVGLISGTPFLQMLRTSIVLAVAAVPEGLLIAVTVILVIGMRRILKRNGLVKKLLAVETLGSVTVICTDKTGTLTEGRMRVTRSEFADRTRALQTAVLCNDLEGPVDAALWEFARTELSADPQTIAGAASRLDEELFSSAAKFMISANLVDGREFDYLKGAPEIVMRMCDIPATERDRLIALADAWAGEGLRMIGLASRPRRAIEDRTGYSWAGLVAMEDPVREGVHESIEVARDAGIQVKMITGDYRRTAERIARNIGLSVEGDSILDGEELSSMSDEELAQRVTRTSVFSRIRPQDKLRIVGALQARGEITAMIGDGVNDAPALKRANVGVVVGSATDVAKETADLILLDNNFRTVVAAVEEGRVIFENIKKVVGYTLSNSFAEVLTIFGAMLFGWPAPLAVAQILWIHLICDGPSDIVLGFEPKEPGIMKEKPKALTDPIMSGLTLSLIGVISVASSIIALVLFNHFYQTHGSMIEAQSFVFGSFAVNSMIYIFAYRSLRKDIFHCESLGRNKILVVTVAGGLLLGVGAFLVPGIRTLLGIRMLSFGQWVLIAAVAFGLLCIVEIGKQIANRVSAARTSARASRTLA